LHVDSQVAGHALSLAKVFLQVICPRRQIAHVIVCHVQLAGGSPLPSTPELNEEASGRSSSPDVKSSDQGQCLLFGCVILSLGIMAVLFLLLLINCLKARLQQGMLRT
jgi:hypothetical protein